MREKKVSLKSNVFIAALLVVLAVFTVAHAASLDINAFKGTLNEVAKYDYGKSRLKLTELSNMIKDCYGCQQDLKTIEKSLADFLSSPATLASKQFACKQLSIIGTEISVPTLATLLAKTETSDMARYALERIPAAEVDEALRKELPNAEGKAKIGIINTLAARGDMGSVCMLEKLAADSEEAIASAAIAGLGRIADSKATKALSKISKKAKGQLKLIAMDSYLQCADKLLKADEKREASKIYEALYDDDNPLNVRIAALKGMVAVSRKPYKVIRKALNNREPTVQTAAISLARDIESEKVTEVLTSAFEELSPLQQVQVLSALEHRDDSSARACVVKAVKSEDDSVSIAALRALGRLGDVSTISLLAETSASSYGPKQEAARESLARLRGENINSAIVESISKADTKVKSELILSLANRNVKTAVGTLLKTAQDSDSKIRITSLKALRDLAGPKNSAELVDLLINSKSSSERTEAEKTVASVLGKNKDASSVLAAFPSVKDIKVKTSLLAVLGRIGDSKALPILRSALKDNNAEIKKAAIRSLSDWPDSEPLNDLFAIAKDDTSNINQVLALRGCVKLISLPSERSVQDSAKLLNQAMELAKGPNEKKLVLSALPLFACQQTLDLAKSCLAEEALTAEAKSAVAKIEKNLKK